jgi:hypothetical protein
MAKCNAARNAKKLLRLQYSHCGTLDCGFASHAQNFSSHPPEPLAPAARLDVARSDKLGRVGVSSHAMRRQVRRNAHNVVDYLETCRSGAFDARREHAAPRLERQLRLVWLHGSSAV